MWNGLFFLLRFLSIVDLVMRILSEERSNVENDVIIIFGQRRYRVEV